MRAIAPLPLIVFESNEATSRSPRHASRTCSTVSKSKPGLPSRLPSTRSTFQPGRVSPSGFTLAWKLCTRPSVLTNVPEVSVKGAIGSSTSAYSRLVLHGVRLTTNSASFSAFSALRGSAQSSSGSTLSSTDVLLLEHVAQRRRASGNPAR